jgi:hypothetical protein
MCHTSSVTPPLFSKLGTTEFVVIVFEAAFMSAQNNKSNRAASVIYSDSERARPAGKLEYGIDTGDTLQVFPSWKNYTLPCSSYMDRGFP